MIAHVAEASEACGRVLLWLNPDAPAMPEATRAAVQLAAAYSAELETLVVETPSAIDIGAVPFAHRSLLGTAVKVSSPSHLLDGRAFLTARQIRAVQQEAARAGVRVSHAEGRGDAIDCLMTKCLERGPWNIIAVSRPPSAELPALISTILANVSGATGIIVAGRSRLSAQLPVAGDVAVVLEDCDRMPSMLRAAERLVPADRRIQILIAAETQAAHAEIDGNARLLTAQDARYVHHRAGPTFGVAGALDCDLFRLKPSFIITRFGGAMLGQVRSLTRLLAISPAPMLLVR